MTDKSAKAATIVRLSRLQHMNEALAKCAIEIFKTPEGFTGKTQAERQAFIKVFEDGFLAGAEWAKCYITGDGRPRGS